MSLERAASVPFPVPYMGRETISVRFKSVDLLWKPAGAMVRFILVDHPTRGRIILLSTDLTMEAQEIILLYSLRFKIEVAFKASGAFGRLIRIPFLDGRYATAQASQW